MPVELRNDATLGGEIVTFTGKIIKPLRPDPDLLDIIDIGHALSNNCRFTGHVRNFYSVAQHSVLCSLIVDKENALAALLHDASEAYLSDIARPIKQVPEFGDTYKAAEARLEQAVALRYELTWPWNAQVKWADNVLLRSEQRDLMPNLLRHEGEEYLDMEIETWYPDEAEDCFLYRYHQLIEKSQHEWMPWELRDVMDLGVTADGAFSSR